MNRTRPRVRAVPARRRRLLPRLVALFVVSVLIGACGAAGLVHWGVAKIDRTVVTGLTRRAAAAEPAVSATPEPRLLNVLLVGNDSREGLSREQIREFGTGQAEGNRTDTIMLVQLELDGSGRGAVLSFPRDLLVTRCDGSRGRINAAYGIGLAREGDGPSCVVSTVSDLTGVDVNHYVEVSFAGFLNVVDALGGVGLYLDEPLADPKAHIDLPAGCVTLRGPDALGFVRARYVDSDFGRIARQQRFIKETVREATEVGVLTNPTKLMRVLDAAAAAVSTDDTLGIDEMRTIATGMQRLTAEGLTVHTVPGEAALSGGSWYVVPNERKAKRLYASFADGSVLDTPPAREERAAPALPAVTVLNATARAGLAEAGEALVTAGGFPVAEVGNATIGGLERTRILHPPQLKSAADKLATLFPDADVIQGMDGLPLTVKLGADARSSDLQDRAAELDRQSPDHDAKKRRAAPAKPTYRGARMTDVDC